MFKDYFLCFLLSKNVNDPKIFWNCVVGKNVSALTRGPLLERHSLKSPILQMTFTAKDHSYSKGSDCRVCSAKNLSIKDKCKDRGRVVKRYKFANFSPYSAYLSLFSTKVA